jgi:peroxiredoxin
MAARKATRRPTKTRVAATKAGVAASRGATKPANAPPKLLAPGTKAPDFTLKSTPDQTITLSQFRGRPVILAFYPADWSPTCGDQLALYNEVLPEFQRHHAELIGISVDSAWCHAAYAKARNLHFPLLADFEPKGAVAKAYGAYTPSAGMSGRALFVLDAKGTIRWSYLSPMGVNPGADGILAALEALDAETRSAASSANAGPAAKHRTGPGAGRAAARAEVREAR